MKIIIVYQFCWYCFIDTQISGENISLLSLAFWNQGYLLHCSVLDFLKYYTRSSYDVNFLVFRHLITLMPSTSTSSIFISTIMLPHFPGLYLMFAFFSQVYFSLWPFKPCQYFWGINHAVVISSLQCQLLSTVSRCSFAVPNSFYFGPPETYPLTKMPLRTFKVYFPNFRHFLI